MHEPWRRLRRLARIAAESTSSACSIEPYPATHGDLCEAMTGRKGRGVPSKILLIDDNEALRRVLRIGLEKRGFTVFELGSGRGAEWLIARRSIDVVVTDLFMPGREGLETICALRESHEELPIVAITGSNMADVATGLGARVCLSKPVSLRTLTRALDEVLDK